MTRLLINGVQYNVEQRDGPTDRPPLVLLHGFTGSAAAWRDHMTALGDACRTVAIDALGHGRSDAPRDPLRYAMPHVVADTITILDQLALDRCVLLGYSMGGRMALHIAVAASDRIAGLILESASPGLRTADERTQRIAADERLAEQIERDGIAAFVDRWERLPLWATQRSLPDHVRAAQRAQRLQSDRIGLANSLRGAGTGAQESLWDQLPSIEMPTLLIAGALDHKFTVIAHEMHRQLPRSDLLITPDAGHAVHLESPEQFDQIVREFMTSIEY